ncbi:MAG: hypothetical protein AAF799_16940 [Myxococcota bacterium]
MTTTQTSDPTVTSLSSFGQWPSFSNDGSTVVFSSGHSLHTVSSAGNDATVLYQGSAAYSASRADWSWSPTTIAFTMNMDAPEGPRAVTWTIDSDGSNAGALNYSGGLRDTYYPSWFEDLKSIVAMDGGDDKHVRLYQFDISAGTATALTDYEDITAGRPSVNPDGTVVAFAGNKGPFSQQDNQIWSVDIASGDITQLEPGQGRSPNWSPDGKWILFESDRSGTYQLYVMPAGGGTPVQLTDGSSGATHGEWNRQQTSIVFQAGRSGISTFPVPSAYQSA